MRQGLSLRLTGDEAADTAKVLGARLIELGKNVEQIDADALERFGSAAAAACACALLARNGVIVIASCEGVEPEGARMDVAIDPNDTPDFAAEKILDQLAERGLVDLESTDYSPEEEEQIRQRLADLGYIE